MSLLTAGLLCVPGCAEKKRAGSRTSRQSNPQNTVQFAGEPTPLVESGRGVNYIPRTVRLTETVRTLSGALPEGTIVVLRQIRRDNLIVEANGVTQEISATSTDLIDQMIDAAER